MDFAGKGLEAAFVRMDLAGEREREQRAAVKTILEADDRGPLGVAARDLDRVLDGLGAAVDQEGFLRKVPGNQRVEPFGQANIALVGSDVKAGVKVTVKLGAHGRRHARRAMAHVEAADAAGEIDQPVAVCVLDDRAFGARHKDRSAVRHAARHGGNAALHQLARARTGNFSS